MENVGELEVVTVEAACAVYGFASKHPNMMSTQTVNNASYHECNYISISQIDSLFG